jgi:hypothetical protein
MDRALLPHPRGARRRQGGQASALAEARSLQDLRQPAPDPARDHQLRTQEREDHAGSVPAAAPHLRPEARPNSQLNSAAQSKEQAAILFKLAAKIVRLSPDLAGVVVIRDTIKELFCPELGTLYKALSAEASTAYGLSPVFIVHDELGQVKGPTVGTLRRARDCRRRA